MKRNTRTPVWQVAYRRYEHFRIFETCASLRHAMEVAHMLLGLGIAQHTVITKLGD